MSDAINRLIFLLVLFGVALIGIRSYRLWRTGKRGMDASELKAWLDDGRDLLVLDVRNPDEFTGELGHIAGAVNLPVQELQARVADVKEELANLRGTTLVVTCKSGVRSSNALWILERAGMQNVHVLKGGMLSWNACGFTVERQ